MAAIHQKRLAKEIKLLATTPPPNVQLEEFNDMTKYLVGFMYEFDGVSSL